MAERKPLVLVSGVQRELGAGDTLGTVALSGTPTAPTASAGTNTTQLASTAFVQTAVAGRVANYSGQSNMLWVGTQAEFDALSSGDKNTVGRVFVIRA